ncbi:MAG: polyprenyl synthetase family protein [Bacteroidetes bacterium]|nr:MAG: polyprenyl synthetase family protein [Bacteroidota bacterium]
MTVKQIKAPVASVMNEFEKQFKSTMKSKTALLDKITHYIIKRKGKQMRPLFVFLSAGVFGEINNRSYTAATLIELLHTATLVHDDVVDESFERRGFFSLNALWKNKIAVLVGDYLLSKGLLVSVEHNEFSMLRIVSNAVSQMSEGELLQIEKSRLLNIDEAVYFDVIRQKTASLISACCEAGANSTTDNKEWHELMAKFGEYTGIAFQIKDDLFDYGFGKDIGKPTGIDIKEKKLTLPLIYAMKKTNKKERKWARNIVKKHNDNPKKTKELIEWVIASGGIEYTENAMYKYRDLALEILHKLPENEFRNSLEGLVYYTINRKK